jgi:hypothetical protein
MLKQFTKQRKHSEREMNVYTMRGEIFKGVFYIHIQMKLSKRAEKGMFIVAHKWSPHKKKSHLFSVRYRSAQ